MNEQQLAAVKQALEALEESVDLVLEDYENAKKLYGNYPSRQARLLGMEDGLKKHEEAITTLQSIISQDALDKKAENARELGLDYEPAPVQPVAQNNCIECANADSWGLPDKPFCRSCVSNSEWKPLNASSKNPATPPAQPAVQEGRDWSLLEATQESLREHMAEIKRLKAAQPAPVQEPVCHACESIEWEGQPCQICQPTPAHPAPVQEPVAEVKAKMTGGNVGIATVIHEIYSPHREPLQPGDKLYAGHRWMGWDIEQVWGERIFGIDMRFENVRDAIKFRAKLDEATPPAPQPVPVKTYSGGKPWPVAPKPWVGLTNDEIYTIGSDDEIDWPAGGTLTFARLIEAKLREKNGGE
jgi:hypothetical protein